MDEEDFDYVPSYVRDRQPEQPLARDFQPVDRGLAERLFKMFRPPFDDSWKMPDLSGPEYRQTPPPGPWFDENSGGNPFRTLEYRIGRDDKDKAELYANAAGSGQDGGGGGSNSMFDPLYPGNGAQSAVSNDVGNASANNLAGNGTYDRYRNNEIVPGAANDVSTRQGSDVNSEDGSFGDKVLSSGRMQLGLPYVLGGDGVTSTDCGKFTLDSYNKAGVNLGTRMADEQHEFCKTNGSVFKDMSQARPGDLVFFQNTYGNWEPGTITHVGIYAGDGKMLHAGSSNGVSHADLNSEYWQSHLAGFGRPHK